LDSENNFTVALCLKEIVSRDLLVQVAYSSLPMKLSHEKCIMSDKKLVYYKSCS
jgi:hypothetical protein